MTLITTPNIADVDRVYQSLIELHRERSEEDSLRINCRLILVLLNHIGDEKVMAEAFALARRDAGPRG